jgi:hypothetical protein
LEILLCILKIIIQAHTTLVSAYHLGVVVWLKDLFMYLVSPPACTEEIGEMEDQPSAYIVRIVRHAYVSENMTFRQSVTDFVWEVFQTT